MGQAWTEFNGTNPLTRPALPKINTSRKLAEVIAIMNNRILPQYVEDAETLKGLHCVIYCGVTAVIRSLGIRITTKHQNLNRTNQRMPPWQQRIQKRIDNLRRDIAQLTEYIRGIKTTKIQRRANKIMG